MPTNFFDKLNHLVKSHINDIVSPLDDKISKSRKKALARHDIRGGLESDVKTLRARIDDALAYQDDMQAKINKLYDDKDEWDAKADKAVEDGRETDARFAIGRIEQAQREIEMLEADLREHQYVTQELISQVNTLDDVVQESAQQPESEVEPTSDKSDVEKIGEQIVTQLDSTRRKLTDLISNYTAQVTGETPANKKHYIMGDGTPVVDEEPEPPRRHPVSKRKVDDDYSARLSRLSKPDKDDKK
ncbi:MAG: PspA/IM30 family protein [Anaerolineae bacterium]|nr:PspA/IM30 family protein [Anaerolineae bacterium]